MAHQLALNIDPDIGTEVACPTADNFTFTGFRHCQIPEPGVALPYGAYFYDRFGGPLSVDLSGVMSYFGPQSQIDPHTHPSAAEMFYVLSGQLGVGFVDSNNELYETTLQTGDVFVFPRGVLHWQRNYGQLPASGFSVLSSASSDTLSFPKALFTGGGKGLPNAVLATAFGTNEWEVGSLKQSVCLRALQQFE